MRGFVDSLTHSLTHSLSLSLTHSAVCRLPFAVAWLSDGRLTNEQTNKRTNERTNGTNDQPTQIGVDALTRHARLIPARLIPARFLLASCSLPPCFLLASCSLPPRFLLARFLLASSLLPPRFLLLPSFHRPGAIVVVPSFHCSFHRSFVPSLRHSFVPFDRYGVLVAPLFLWLGCGSINSALLAHSVPLQGLHSLGPFDKFDPFDKFNPFNPAHSPRRLQGGSASLLCCSSAFDAVSHRLSYIVGRVDDCQPTQAHAVSTLLLTRNLVVADFLHHRQFIPSHNYARAVHGDKPSLDPRQSCGHGRSKPSHELGLLNG